MDAVTATHSVRVEFSRLDMHDRQVEDALRAIEDAGMDPKVQWCSDLRSTGYEAVFTVQDDHLEGVLAALDDATPTHGSVTVLR